MLEAPGRRPVAGGRMSKSRWETGMPELEKTDMCVFKSAVVCAFHYSLPASCSFSLCMAAQVWESSRHRKHTDLVSFGGARKRSGDVELMIEEFSCSKA